MATDELVEAASIKDVPGHDVVRHPDHPQLTTSFDLSSESERSDRMLSYARQMDWKTLTVLLLTNLAYLFGGGAVFYALEKPHSSQQSHFIAKLTKDFVGKCTLN